jgi:hypothetical protein
MQATYRKPAAADAAHAAQDDRVDQTRLEIGKLRLNIVPVSTRETVCRHGSDLTVDSSVGIGSVFEFKLTKGQAPSCQGVTQ